LKIEATSWEATDQQYIDNMLAIVVLPVTASIWKFDDVKICEICGEPEFIDKH